MGIGTVLLDHGVITQPQLDDALAQQRATGERLDRVLVRMGVVDADQVLQAIGDQFHLDVVDLDTTDVESSVLQTLPASLVQKQRCVPIRQEHGILTVATSDPFELSVLDELRLLTGYSIELVLADDDGLQRFIRANYGVGSDTLDALSAEAGVEVKTKGDEDEIEQAQEASVIKLVNDILLEAVRERATDVHIEPYEHRLIVRYRIDGVLQRANVPESINRFSAAIISRLKIMANMNIAEKRKPQDGRIALKQRLPDQSGRMVLQEFDLRVSVIPMLFGEGVVLRILNKSAVLMELSDLGMPEWIQKGWYGLIERPYGILLVTGPTGSGKSTTLYASLNRIVSEEIKAITVEDPVEYHVGGVNQIQVNTKVGLTFSAGLRSILRHDPDVVMIGEIRDKETAETAVQASLTGHLVFSTLHTNDSPGAMTRLLDMGVEPFLVSSSVEGVLAQRLVRRVCKHCATAYTPDATDLPPGFDPEGDGTLTRGAGCRECRQSGYRGRVGLYELLKSSDRLRDDIMHGRSAGDIAKHALKDGTLQRMSLDGFAKARAGATTISEVMRVLTV
ncbi:MAG: GspE/PulE family protein [Phycisphaera sp.]|nr:MAG: GspE/PulE family protein [Phycisphaera sp.]